MTKDHETDTDDLVERLEDSKGWPNLGKAAAARILADADRIEALSAELSETKKDVTDMETRALEAEAENARLRGGVGAVQHIRWNAFCPQLQQG